MKYPSKQVRESYRNRPRKRQDSPHTAPDSVEPQGPCPYCGNIAAFTVTAVITTNYEEGLYAANPDGTSDRIPRERVAVLHCQGCDMGMVVVEDQVIDDNNHLAWEGKHWWPPATTARLDPSVPQSVREALDEGLKCRATHAPRGAAVMYRLTLQLMVADNGSAAAQAKVDKNLNDGLEQMWRDGDLSKDLWDWTHELRFAGNAGAHHNPLDPVTDEEAEELQKFLAELIETWYTRPARVRRARGHNPPRR